MIFTFLCSIILVTCVKDTSELNGKLSSNKENVKELVQKFSERKISRDQTASITSQEFIVINKDGDEVDYELPEDEFFVSIASFIQETHPCENHRLTGCQGGLAQEEFDVYIENSKGKVIIDKKMKSLSNGFIDLWLPRNETFSVTIKYKNKITTSIISTFNLYNYDEIDVINENSHSLLLRGVAYLFITLRIDSVMLQ